MLLTLAVARYGAVGGDLGAFMTGSQIFTYTLVNTLSVPCVATIAVLGRELGWRRAALVAAFTVTLAVTAGGLVRLALA